MPKKKEMKQIFENLDVESSEAQAGLTEPAKADPEPQAAPSEAEQAVSAEDRLAVETPPVEQPEPSSVEAEENSQDDLLDDVRRSLLEEAEAQDQGEGSKWWHRFGRSSRKKAVDEQTARPVEEINMPMLAAIAPEETQAAAEKEADDYQDEIDELIDLLETEEEEKRGGQPLTVPAEDFVEPEKPADLEELKKQAFQPRQEEEESLTEVRAIALEGGEEVFVEVEATQQDPLEERLNAAENALKPYQRYIYFAFAFLGLVMAVTAAFLIYNAYQRSVAQQAVPTEVSNLPFPTEVSLPGGWSFNLGKGALQDGNWNPAGAEWLQGTEVCRWVALPWSPQLEAVIRTLKAEDQIELGMSNNDKLRYSVYSIRQMSPEEMRELDSNSPCLLIVLAEPEAEKRWVLTALP